MAYDTLYKLALSGMTFLAPGKERAADHAIMADAFARVVEEERPFFKDDESKERTMSVMIAVAFREGSLRPRVVGDCSESKPGEPCKGKPHSFCTFQVHDSNGGTPALNDDPVLCARTAHAMLRTSMRVCPDKPINQYANGGGYEACKNARATAITNDRMWIAKRVLAYWKKENNKS